MTYLTPYSRTPHVTLGLLISQKTMFSFLRFLDVMGTKCQFVMKFFFYYYKYISWHIFTWSSGSLVAKMPEILSYRTRIVDRSRSAMFTLHSQLDVLKRQGMNNREKNGKRGVLRYVGQKCAMEGGHFLNDSGPEWRAPHAPSSARWTCVFHQNT